MKHHTLGDLTPQDNGQRVTSPCAECERLRTVEKWAREFVAQEESAMGDVNDRTHAYQQLRTALDAGEPLPNVGTPADVPADGNGGAPDLAQTFAAREARDAGEDATKELPEYEQVYDDEWIQPEPQIGHRIRCCGCGLEHQMDFRIENGAVQFNAHRLAAMPVEPPSNAPRNMHSPNNSTMHPDGRIGGTR